ncbi:DUF2267 domain-containing protein [Salinilacihabitans rarus]|uniref:DUF2267 domain-containing protein n=1 Tax=Salinilacihabitans rarus TaxID=2961596 RepID=UPI0020C91A86|nr:DUF2267 domain-containing protein [Salinilacihabitans rarus]
MQETEFYALVRRHGHVDGDDRAQAASEAVLGTLGETVSGGQAEDVAARLPDDLAGTIEHADHDAAGYDRAAFVDRVAERLRGTDLEPDDAERYADAVTDALTATLTEGELRNLKAQLTDDVRPFFENVDVGRDGD